MDQSEVQKEVNHLLVLFWIFILIFYIFFKLSVFWWFLLFFCYISYVDDLTINVYFLDN